jgi:hypothetical protein
MANDVVREHAGEMSIQHLVGQIRSTGFDLAPAIGTAEPAALELVRAGSEEGQESGVGNAQA